MPGVTLYIDSKNYPDLPRMTVDDSGEIKLTFVVVGVSKTEDGNISYTLEGAVTGIDVEEQSLNSIVNRAAKGAYADTPMVKTQFTPAGS